MFILTASLFLQIQNLKISTVFNLISVICTLIYLKYYIKLIWKEKKAINEK
jgi:hypothetical protein